jgi:hypothetical protein
MKKFGPFHKLAWSFYPRHLFDDAEATAFHLLQKRAYELVVRAPDNLLLDRCPNIGPLISRWERDKFKNCWNKSFTTSKILTLLYQQFSNLLISHRDEWSKISGTVQ